MQPSIYISYGNWYDPTMQCIPRSCLFGGDDFTNLHLKGPHQAYAALADLAVE